MCSAASWKPPLPTQPVVIPHANLQAPSFERSISAMAFLVPSHLAAQEDAELWPMSVGLTGNERSMQTSNPCNYLYTNQFGKQNSVGILSFKIYGISCLNSQKYQIINSHQLPKNGRPHAIPATCYLYKVLPKSGPWKSRQHNFLKNTHHSSWSKRQTAKKPPPRCIKVWVPWQMHPRLHFWCVQATHGTVSVRSKRFPLWSTKVITIGSSKSGPSWTTHVDMGVAQHVPNKADHGFWEHV